MKRIILAVAVLFLLTNSFGQRNELNIALNSGLFSFSGPSAEKISHINYNDQTNSGYSNNPYGSRNGLCYGLSADLKRIFKNNLLAGLGLGYEILRSKVMISAIEGYTGTSTYEYNASGKTFLNYHFITLCPSFGYRFNLKKCSFDLSGGFEVAYCLKTTEKGSATATNGIKYTTSLDRKTIKSDIRPEVRLAGNYHKAGIYIGYSYGLANYRSGYVGGINQCASRLIRFGLSYQLK